MNLNLLTNTHNVISFKSRYDKYFDSVEDAENYKIIPEYEETDIQSQQDGILSDFLREDELYDRRRDYPTKGYRIYDYDDVELAENMKYKKVPKDILNKSSYQESRGFASRPSCIYVPSSPQFYTVEDAWKEGKESFQSRLDQGFKRSDISNIYHFSLIKVDDEGNKKMNLKLADKGFKLLKSGRGIYEVAGLMDKSKLSYADGSQRYSPELLDFLSVYPDERETVVEGRRGYELLRRDIIEFYSQISEVCPDGKDIKRIVNSCQINSKPDKELISLCLDTIRDGESVQNASGCIKKAILSSGYGDNDVFNGDLYKFLLNHPKSRQYVVVTKSGHEYFDTERVKDYLKIEELTSDKNDVGKIIDSCIMNDVDWQNTVDKRLFGLAENLLKKDSKWSSKHEKIMSSVVKTSRYCTKTLNDRKFELASAMAEGNYNIPAIYSAVVLNMKNVELLG